MKAGGECLSRWGRRVVVWVLALGLLVLVLVQLSESRY